MLQNRTEWVIYKNQQKIGQGITWHKALDVLIKQEKLNWISLDIYSRLIQVTEHNHSDKRNTYKIIKER